MEAKRMKAVVLRLEEAALEAVDACASGQRLTRTSWIRLALARSIRYDTAILLPSIRAAFEEHTEDKQPC